LLYWKQVRQTTILRDTTLTNRRSDMIDHKLLKEARENIQKEAFNPMTPEAQAAAAQQGAAPPPPGSAPPMDPAMMDPAMAGMPMDPAMAGMPMDPAMMDPAMMGGAPPMDPAMAGMPMDPAMMDPAMMGAPVEDPAAAGTPVTLTLEDLRTVMKEIGGGEGPEAEGEPKRATNKQIMEELTSVREMLSALAAGMGIQLPAGDVGAGADTGVDAETANPEDIAAMAQEVSGGMPMDPMSEAMAMGLPPGEMPPAAMPKMAVDKWSQTRAGKIAQSGS
jgi:hypothetical protein